MKILVVCTGNTCRSPTFAVILKRFLYEYSAVVESAGTDAPLDAPANAHMRAFVESYGCSLQDHVSRFIENAHLADYDLFVCMEPEHENDIRARCHEVRGRRFIVLNVSDPSGGTFEDYRQCFQVLVEKAQALAREIRSSRQSA